MNRRPVIALVVTQVGLALALLVVALQVSTVAELRQQVGELRAENTDMRARLERAEADRVGLQRQVDQLTAALIARGGDPDAVIAPSSTATTAPSLSLIHI